VAVNAIDLIIVATCAVAAIGGYRLGFLTRVAAWLGMTLGVLAAAQLSPTLSARFDHGHPGRTLFITAVTLLVGAFIGQLAGQTVGHRLRARTATGSADTIDRVAGACSGVVVVAMVVWLLAPTMVSATSWPARLVDDSLLAEQIDRLTPDPPDALDAASRLVGAERWAALQAGFAGGLPEGDIPVVADADPTLDRRVRLATVLVEHQVCGHGTQDGTGFVAAPNLVVSNAHVVAGIPDRGATVHVVDNRGRRHRARVVHFDPLSDLSVLRVETLTARPLPLAEESERDQVGWVYGHPGGRALAVRPFRAGTEADAVVPDIYGEQEITRRIVPIRADLQHGDSGSPLVATDGRVIGVAFAISPDDETLAVAVAMELVRDAVDRSVAAGPDAPDVGTGRCTPH